MDFDFTEEQDRLRGSVASYLAHHYSFEARRAATSSAPGWRPQLWRGLAVELNLFGAAFPESLGGFGGSAIEHALVMEEFGKALVVEPYLSTVVIGGGALKYAGGPLMEAFVPRIIAGELVIALAHAEQQARYELADVKTTATREGEGYRLRGNKSVVVAAPWSTHLLVVARTHGAQRERAGITLLLVDKDSPGIRLHEYPTFDGGRAAQVAFADVFVPAERVVGAEGAGLPLLERVVDEATCALCAEAVGVMRRMLADTVSYTSQRKQFGIAISSFQALQHRMADMFVQLEQSSAITQVATMKLTGDAVERARAVSAAKAHVGNAAKFVGQAAVQLHGGMGVTEELALGHYFRRATAIGNLLGSSVYHLQRYAALART